MFDPYDFLPVLLLVSWSVAIVVCLRVKDRNLPQVFLLVLPLPLLFLL